MFDSLYLKNPDHPWGSSYANLRYILFPSPISPRVIQALLCDTFQRFCQLFWAGLSGDYVHQLNDILFYD